MHTGTLKKLALALTFWLALHMSSLRALIFSNDLPLQAVTIGTNPVDFEFRGDGTLIAKGNYGIGSLGTGDQGDGTRMFWFPSLGAFRAGTVSTGLSIGSGPWDAANIGNNSVAFGENNTASGYYSAAFGIGNTASGADSLVSGIDSIAWGARSVALGNTTSAYGEDSIAGDFFSSASGQQSLAIGGFVTASGAGSVASGYGSLSSAYCAVSFGHNNIASGSTSTASGAYTTASAYLDFTIGTYNTGGGNATAWVSSDPLFEVGNGTAATPSDAMVVYKDGSAAFQGPVTVAPGGDIPMYTGE